MIYILLNLAPIGAATLVALLLGLARHALSGGGRLGLGVSLTALVAHFWFAAILAGALILAPPKADPWVMALASAGVIWAGFVAPALALTGAYRGVGVARLLGDCLYWLVAMLAEAAVMKAIGLVPPPVG
ncbi:MAG: hypothetical protein A4S12_08245 [Proteobacteria bacterium SG_bin5]|nr:hypothetical protein [Sphingomonas sp.]OQW41559.1 MAG: hypothetical protein A4S12_08245 [Proteobacteria bacterium SG_bin5]